MKINKRNRIEHFFLGVVITLLAGVPLTILSIYFFAENVTSLAVSILLGILIFAALFTLLVIFRKRVSKRFFGTSKTSLEEAASATFETINHIVSGEKDEALSKSEEATTVIASYYSWVKLRGWMINVIIGMVAGFGTLMASALLYKQNDLIETQNKLLLETNKKNFEFINNQSKIFNQERKITTAKILDDSLSPAIIRSEAVEEFFGLKKREVKDYYDQMLGSNYQGFELSDVTNIKADFSRLTFYQCNFSNAHFDLCNFRGTQFYDCNMEGVTFNGGHFEEAEIAECNLKNARFETLNLDDLYIQSSNIEGATFSPIDQTSWKDFWQYNTNKGQYTFSYEVMDSIVTMQDLIQEEQGSNVTINLRDINLDHYFGKNGLISTGKYPLRAYHAEYDSIWSIIE
jgi:uncharacterized protein YjbI with pentapeptide repeats